MRNQVGLVAVGILAATTLAFAEGEGPYEFATLGQPPAVLGPVLQEAASLVRLVGGEAFVAGLDINGNLIGWGDFEPGYPYLSTPFFIPADLGPCKDLRASRSAIAAIRADGTFAVWGVPGVAAYPPPAIREPVTDLELSWYFPTGFAGQTAAFAIGSSGQLFGWGSPTCTLLAQAPIGTGDCKDVAVCAAEAILVRNDGSVTRWPAPFLAVSGTITPALQVAYLEEHTPLVLRSDGALFKLSNEPGSASASQIDADIAEIVHNNRSVVLVRKTNGTVLPVESSLPVGWDPGPLVDAIGLTTQVFSFSAAVVDPFIDCNTNGIDDDNEIIAGTALDCDGNWVPDACQFGSGELEDCNANGIADSCEKSGAAFFDSGQLSPIGYTSPQTWEPRFPPQSVSDVTLTVQAFGDFSARAEKLLVTLNGAGIGNAFASGADCAAMPSESFSIGAAEFNALVASGGVQFGFVPTIAVDGNLCPGGTWVRATLSYTAASSLDCNANGLLDECEIAQGFATDCNGNGIPDECENLSLTDCNLNGESDDCDIAGGRSADCNGNGVPDECDLAQFPELDCNANGQFDSCEIADGTASDCNANGRPDSCDIADGLSADINSNQIPDECERFPCPGDVNGDDHVNGADLAVILGFWGPVGPYPAADIDGNGVVNAADLAIVLGGWGSCP